jgi:hypothetical protein
MRTDKDNLLYAIIRLVAGNFNKKIVNDPELRENLIDAALIEKAKKVKDKSVSATEYFSRHSHLGTFPA